MKRLFCQQEMDICLLKLTVSVEFLIRMDPFHHVMVGAGLDPTTSQNSSCSVPADKGLFSPCNLTHNGRTEIMNNLGLYLNIN